MTELKSLVVIDCLRRESVFKLAWCKALLYDTNGKIMRMARFCSCSNSVDKYAGQVKDKQIFGGNIGSLQLFKKI